MKKYIFLAALAWGILIPADGQVVNCPSGFSSSGACGTGSPGEGHDFVFFGNGGATLSGSTIDLQPAGVNHNPNSVIYQTAVSTRAFTTTFKFTPNAWNIAFVLENATTNGGAGPSPPLTLAQSFTSGAGCEGGFYQAFGGSGHPPPNNIFALNFDSGNLLVNSLSPFYSNVQIYQQIQSPCMPDDGQPWFYYSNKVSTSPVAMNSPATTYQTTTGDTYSATIIYTGTNLVLNMYNISAGGTCSPPTSSTCFTYTWQGVNIPSLVDGTTAYLGFTGATNSNSPRPLALSSLIYSALSPASEPSFSPSSGTYGSNQPVTLSSSGAVICYSTTGAPSTNGQAGCTNGTRYTGAISVPSGETIYAVAGGSGYADSTVGMSAYKIGSTASQPTFYPAQGTYQGHQTVLLSAAQGSVICYNTTGSPETNGATGCANGTLYTGPITVSSDETIHAVAGGPGFGADSVVGSAAYIISPFAVVDGFTGSYPANSPTYSPIPGTYSGSQSVTLSTSTSGAYICYIASSTPPTLLPETNNLGECSVGTRYSGAISVRSSETIYAIASTAIGNLVAGTGPPSSLVQGSYTIGSGTTGGTTVSTPTFSPGAGTYTQTQSVKVSTTSSGATIYYTNNGATPSRSSTEYTGPISVSSTETLKAIAVAPRDNDSAVATAAYTMSTQSPGGSGSTTISTTAWYNIVNNNSNLCVDADDGRTANGTAVLQYTCGPAQSNQEWQFQPTDSGYYQLVNRNALNSTGKNLVWDVTGGPGSTADGIPIQLWTYSRTTNQQWMPVLLSNGAFKFVARNSSECLDVSGASVAVNTRLQQFHCNGTAAQSYTLKQK